MVHLNTAFAMLGSCFINSFKLYILVFIHEFGVCKQDQSKAKTLFSFEGMKITERKTRIYFRYTIYIRTRSRLLLSTHDDSARC